MAISKSTSNVGKADFLTWYLFCYGQERFCNNFENAFVSSEKKIKLTFWGQFLDFLKGTNSFILWEDYLLCRNITRHESSCYLDSW